MSRPVEDVLRMREMIESFAERRAEDEKRVYPRFMTPEGLNGEMDLRRPAGMLVCRKKGAQDQQQGGAGGTRAPVGEFEKLSDMCFMDFSEEGAQIYFHCGNPAKIRESRLFLQIGSARIPVLLRWYQPSAEGHMAGFEFVEAQDRSPDLASLLVSLSDRLVDFLLYEHLPKWGKDHDQACIYTYLSIFYNLRLRFLETVAAFYKAQECAERCVTREQHRDIMRTLFEFESLRTLHFKQSKALGRDKPFQATLDLFMKPFLEYHCGISGEYNKVCFLENDVLNALINSVVFWNWSIPPPDELNERVRPAYRAFLTLRANLPGVFDDEQYDRQFVYYSFLIRSIILLKDQLIDIVSASCPFAGQARARNGAVAAMGRDASEWRPEEGADQELTGIVVRATQLLGEEEFQKIGTPALERRLTETYGSDSDLEPAIIRENAGALVAVTPEPRQAARGLGRYLALCLVVLSVCVGVAILAWWNERPVPESGSSRRQPSVERGVSSGPQADVSAGQGAAAGANAEVSRAARVAPADGARQAMREGAARAVAGRAAGQVSAMTPDALPDGRVESPGAPYSASERERGTTGEVGRTVPGHSAISGEQQEGAEGRVSSVGASTVGEGAEAHPASAALAVGKPSEGASLPGASAAGNPPAGETVVATAAAGTATLGNPPPGGTVVATTAAGTSGAVKPTAGASGAACPGEAATAIPVPAVTVHTFEIEAKGSSWIQVNVDREKAWSKLMKSGDRYQWDVHERIQLVVGNAGGVLARWDGRELGDLGRWGQVVRLILPEPQRTPKTAKAR